MYIQSPLWEHGPRTKELTLGTPVRILPAAKAWAFCGEKTGNIFKTAY